MKGGLTEKDFIGFAVLSTTRFPLKGEVLNHKGICDQPVAVCPPDGWQEQKSKLRFMRETCGPEHGVLASRDFHTQNA